MRMTLKGQYKKLITLVATFHCLLEHRIIILEAGFHVAQAALNVAEDDLSLLFLLPLPPPVLVLQRHVLPMPCLCGVGIKSRALCILGKHFTN